jgi:hypothetical protein
MAYNFCKFESCDAKKNGACDTLTHTHDVRDHRYVAHKKRDLMPRASITFGLLRPKAREKLRQRTEVQCRRELVVVFN